VKQRSLKKKGSTQGKLGQWRIGKSRITEGGGQSEGGRKTIRWHVHTPKEGKGGRKWREMRRFKNGERLRESARVQGGDIKGTAFPKEKPRNRRGKDVRVKRGDHYRTGLQKEE